MQMRDDWTRKNTIPNKSNEFIQQEASFWPAIYMLLCVKSMAISAVNIYFWRVKRRKWSDIATPKTYKQLCVSKIQKLLMLGVFAPTIRVDCLHAKDKEARCQEKFICNTSQTPCWRTPAWNEYGTFSTHLLNTSSHQNCLTSCRKTRLFHLKMIYFVVVYSVEKNQQRNNQKTRKFTSDIKNQRT